MSNLSLLQEGDWHFFPPNCYHCVLKLGSRNSAGFFLPCYSHQKTLMQANTALCTTVQPHTTPEPRFFYFASCWKKMITHRLCLPKQVIVGNNQHNSNGNHLPLKSLREKMDKKAAHKAALCISGSAYPFLWILVNYTCIAFRLLEFPGLRRSNNFNQFLRQSFLKPKTLSTTENTQSIFNIRWGYCWDILFYKVSLCDGMTAPTQAHWCLYLYWAGRCCSASHFCLLFTSL